MFAQVDDMQLKNKDVFIVLGPTRPGKGTLLTALKGVPMKLFRKKDHQDTAAAKEAH